MQRFSDELEVFRRNHKRLNDLYDLDHSTKQVGSKTLETINFVTKILKVPNDMPHLN